MLGAGFGIAALFLYLGTTYDNTSGATVTILFGAILSTALLVGPAAAALRLTTRPGRAIATAAVIGVSSTWLGVLLAYDSYDWTASHKAWPPSFFIVTVVLAAYLLAGRFCKSGRRGRGLSA